MPGNALIGVDLLGQLPAVFNNRASSLNGAVQQGVQAGFAVISYKGRNFHIKYRGEEELVTDPMRPDVPSAYLTTVIIGAAGSISKQYYINQYTEGNSSAPDCYSIDGVKPEDNSPQKQANICATCPQNQWGSRITADGRRAKRCQDARRIAVVPAGDIMNEAFDGPMLLRIPPMSLNNLALYGAGLARRGVPLEAVVTRISFDYSVAYPQLTFTPERLLTNEEAMLVVGANNDGMLSHPALDRILYASVAELGPDADEPQEQPSPPQQPPPQPEPQPSPAQPPAEPVQPPPAQPAATTQAAPSPTAPPAAPAVVPAAPATPRRRTAAFAGAVPVAVAPSAQTPQAAPVPNGSAGAVTVAPANMQQAIDDLLTSPGS